MAESARIVLNLEFMCIEISYLRIPSKHKTIQKSPDPPSRHAILEAICAGVGWVWDNFLQPTNIIRGRALVRAH